MNHDQVTIVVQDGKGYNAYGEHDKGDILATCLCVGFFLFLIVVI